MYKVVVHRLTDFSESRPEWAMVIIQIQIPKQKQWSLRVQIDGQIDFGRTGIGLWPQQKGWTRTRARTVFFEGLLELAAEYPGAVSLLVRELL